MKRMKAGDFPPEVLQLFDGVVHGRISRRDFLDRAARYAVGGFTAAAMLEALTPNFAWAEQVKPGDARIAAGYTDYLAPKGSGSMRGYLAQPAQKGRKRAAIVVIHENRGLNPYIEDVARRLAVEGYVAFAPDAPHVRSAAIRATRNAPARCSRSSTRKNGRRFRGRSGLCCELRPDFNGKLGAIGFCFGGGIVNRSRCAIPDLAAGVPFYGEQPGAVEAAKIHSPLLLHYAASTDRITADGRPSRRR